MLDSQSKKKLMFLSVIIPVKFEDRIKRTTKRLLSCLRSLDVGYQKDNDYEIIVSDLDSDLKFVPEIKDICSKFSNCKLIRHTGEKFWCRSRAINEGIKVASGKYILSTDLDMIFSSNMVRIVRNNVAQKTFLQCHCKYVDKDFGDDVSLSMIPELEKNYHLSKDFTAGGFQCIDHHRLIIHPFDESFKVWGADDSVMRDCLIEDGYALRWIDDQISMYHLWHKSYLDIITQEEMSIKDINLSMWFSKVWAYKAQKVHYKELEI